MTIAIDGCELFRVWHEDEEASESTGMIGDWDGTTCPNRLEPLESQDLVDDFFVVAERHPNQNTPWRQAINPLLMVLLDWY